MKSKSRNCRCIRYTAVLCIWLYPTLFGSFVSWGDCCKPSATRKSCCRPFGHLFLENLFCCYVAFMLLSLLFVDFLKFYLCYHEAALGSELIDDLQCALDSAAWYWAQISTASRKSSKTRGQERLAGRWSHPPCQGPRKKPHKGPLQGALQGAWLGRRDSTTTHGDTWRGPEAADGAAGGSQQCGEAAPRRHRGIAWYRPKLRWNFDQSNSRKGFNFI